MKKPTQVQLAPSRIPGAASGDAGLRRHVVLACPLQPYPGVGNAGGELLLRHAELLSKEFEVTLLIAPEPWAPYRADLAQGLPFRTIQLQGSARGQRGGTSPAVIRLVRRALAAPAFRGFWLAAWNDPEARQALQSADFVELQWFELVSTLRELRDIGVTVPVSGYIHDVNSQRSWREVKAGATLAKRLLALLRYVFARWMERRLIGRLDHVLCLSDKDAVLLVGAGADDDRVHVLPPPLREPHMPSVPPDLSGRPAEVLFVADFGRSVNSAAASWLVERVWPEVRRLFPEATLTLAGGRVSRELEDRVRFESGVTTTGFLPTLDDVYGSARVAVSPMLSGAGVKIKSVVPMLWGVPVVATSVGAEGIQRSWFAAVEDDPVLFAAAVVEALEVGARTDGVRRTAFAGSCATYSPQAYATTLKSLYA